MPVQITQDLSIPPQATAKDLLHLIDDWAVRASSEEAKRLWFILAAMRGPDIQFGGNKSSTTSVIRQMALPNLANAGNADTAYSATEDSLRMLAEPPGNDLPMDVAHFRSHIRRAAQALLGQPLD